MGEAVIIDDGGSTRIRWSKEGILGEMDTLLSVSALAANPSLPAGSQGSKHSLSKGVNDKDFDTLRIAWQDNDGKAQYHDYPLADRDKVFVSSHFDQSVLLELYANRKKLDITLYSDVMEPMVEARQHSQKRRYIVSNSGPIEKVAIERFASGSEVLYVTGAEPPGATTVSATIPKPIIYTSVVVI